MSEVPETKIGMTFGFDRLCGKDRKTVTMVLDDASNITDAYSKVCLFFKEAYGVDVVVSTMDAYPDYPVYGSFSEDDGA